jgi:hypothetical protein
MRRWLVLGLLVLPFLVRPAASADDKDVLSVGKNLPGTFHPFNVNAVVSVSEEPEEDKAEKPRLKRTPYSTKFKYHCLISEYDLDPVVMLLARGLEDNAELKELLKKLDAKIDANRRSVRLRAFIVFLQDDITSLTEEDDKRDEVARRLERLAEDLKLRNVVVALAAKGDLAKYKLDDATALTAVLYKKLKIEATHRFAADKVDAAAVKAVLADVSAKLGAKK